jgi:hypothetical protein
MQMHLTGGREDARDVPETEDQPSQPDWPGEVVPLVTGSQCEAGSVRHHCITNVTVRFAI